MTRRPHIILEALQVGHQPAGTGRAISDLCLALAGRDRGLKFTILASQPEVFGDMGQQENWNVVACDGAKGGTLKKAWYTQVGLPGLVRELGGDLLHCLQFLGPLRCSCPMVSTVYDLAWMFYPQTIEAPRRFYYRWLVPRTMARSEAVIACSASTAGEIASMFPGVAERIRVTPLGTPLWARERAEESFDRAPIPEKPFFLFVGTMEPRKNLSRLLEAFDLFHSRAIKEGVSPDAVPGMVFVGGRGWKDSKLRSRMGSLQDQGRLTVHDYIDDTTLWDLYGSALALVFPSLYEGFGLPILEAMMAGLPVLTSDRSGMKEVAGDGALLVNPESVTEIVGGLRVMAFESATRQRLAAGGPERALQWSWERTADRTEEVYREVLGLPDDK
jgi:alpha-1,3-rhamnosyl/mannosyltransferase